MPRTILLVDDSALNRLVLKKTLQQDYIILEAENGRQALQIMQQSCETLSAVLLDIVMPELDGYEALRLAREDPRLAQLPIIMVTGSEDEESRMKALGLGANDFILKPINPEIVKHCIKNNIAMRETAATLNALRRDKLTGLLSREAFLEKVAELVQTQAPGYYILSCFDVENFKLINDQYGTQEGDRILREIGRTVAEDMQAVGGVAGRISGDNFAALLPAEHRDFSITRIVQQNRRAFSDKQAVVFSVGRYVITDLSLPASAIYDRAYIAKLSVKGRYDTHIAYFDDAMLELLLRNQRLTQDVDTALTQRQFEVWYQPQRNHATGALVGAEALVRWRHPEKGLIPPGDFIPIFEQNGFVYELDKYVWNQACRDLRRWLDQGGDPVPVSVNVSRYDVFRPDFIQTLTGLLETYVLPVELLRLEITESAFAHSTKQIVEVVLELIARGFTVEIDDFGSGYSSLNTLKSVPAQVLKLDMRFLEDGEGEERTGNILESVVRMAKWMGMSVIAEGVEDRRQADYLASIGCSYIQGYLYARPMPVADYETYCGSIGKEERLLTMETVDNLDNNSFWNPKSMDTLIFNSYVGAACIFEYYNHEIELLRANGKFAAILGDGTMSVEDTLKLNWLSCLAPESRTLVQGVLKDSTRTREEYTREYVFLNIPGAPAKTYLRATMRVIAMAGDRSLVYCTSENITAQRQAEQEIQATSRQLQALMDDMPGGFVRMYQSPNGLLTPFYFNEGFAKLTGMNRQELRELFLENILNGIHPEDHGVVKRAVEQMGRTGKGNSSRYRIRQNNGDYIWVTTFGRLTTDTDGKSILNAYFLDATEQMRGEELQKALMDNLPCGAGIYEFQNGQMSLTYQNRIYWELVGLNEEAYPDTSSMSAIHPEDIPTVMQELTAAIEEKRDVNCSIRLRHLTRGYNLVRLAGRIVEKDNGGFSIYATFTPIAYDARAIRRTESWLELLTNSIPGGIAVYEGSPDDLAHIQMDFFSDGLARLLGCTREGYQRHTAEKPFGMTHPADIPKLRDNILALVQTGAPMDCVYRACLDDGTVKWLNVKAVLGEAKGDRLTANAVFFDVTQLQVALEKLRVSEEVNRLAIGHSRAAVCQYHVAQKRLVVVDSSNSIFQGPAVEENIPDQALKDGLISEDTADAYLDFYARIHRGETSGSARFRRQSSQGWRWVEARFTTIFSDEGQPDTAVITFFDVTESLQRDVAYKKWQQSLGERLPASYALYQCNLTRGTVLDTAQGQLIPAEQFTDTRLAERTASYVQTQVYPQDRERFRAFLNRDALLLRSSQGRRTDCLEYREVVSSGVERWLRLTVYFVESPNSTDVEAELLFENIDEAKRAELEILERAETDPLTGSYNRTVFVTQVNQRLAQPRKGMLSALFIVDLDNFKMVNDCFGHAIGDETLIEISQKLGDTFRNQDLICRLGGDEFMVWMGEVTHLAAVKERAALVCALLHKSFSVEVQLSVSVGIAICPDHGLDFDTLYHNADLALYHVKNMGKDNYALYTPTMQERGPEQLAQAQGNTIPVKTAYAEPKRRMLIVEDNEISRDYLAGLFDQEYIIDTAAEGTAALIRLRRYGSGISVVLLDLMMPGVDGFAVLKQMRQSVTMQAIPVVVVSGLDERETCLEAIRSGASDFITKPVDPELLKLRVASAVSRAENDQLRARNRYLALQNEEARRLTEARQHSEELTVALKAAERADLAKSQFLSSMSHEIRTPLNAVIGYNNIARNELNAARTDTQRRQASMKVLDCLTKSEVASKHLLTIINDVLDMSAIESGKLKVDDAPFDFRSLITSLTVMFFSQARAKGVNFEVLFHKPTEEWFVGDQLRVNQILTNLLSNAVKFTPEGGSVTLTITETTSAETAAGFRFIVADTGIGMTQEYLAHIWTPFEQAEASISRRFGGTGLGLSITKNLVDLMGGTIAVDSTSGVGSTFTVDLTFTRTDQPKKPTGYDFSQVHALVVDDETSTCDYIKILFDRCGASCKAFTTGQAAISAFAAAREAGTPFNVCLVDWRMPGMDGFATIQEIRRIAGRDVPIVVVTAYDFAEVADQTQTLGISRFISKPLFQSSLYDLLATISGQQTPQADEEAPSYNFSGMRVLLAEDNNMNMEVAKYILRSAGIETDCAWNGQEAIDIFRASRKGAYRAILMDVHMPEVDGYQATRMIRASSHPDAQSIPIIAMTADVFAEDIAEAHSAGMNDHIAKPVDVDSLLKVLASYMEDA